MYSQNLTLNSLCEKIQFRSKLFQIISRGLKTTCYLGGSLPGTDIEKTVKKL